MDIHIDNAQAAYAAVNAVFGDDISGGPRIPRGYKTIEDLIANWPTVHDEVIDFALHLPWTFDISRQMAKNERKAVMARGHLVRIRHASWHVGNALRVDEPSIGSIQAWIAAHEAHRHNLRK